MAEETLTERLPVLSRQDEGLKILLTNITLSGRTGTEIVTRDIALGLRRRGHRPVVLTQDDSGPIAEELRSASIPVTTDISQIAGRFDLIHGHHTPTMATAASRYPSTPAVFLAHDFGSWFDAVPRFSSIRRVCAVDTTVAQRFSAYQGLDPETIAILYNAVDMQRFKPGAALPVKPRRALVFAKNAQHLEAVRAACLARDIEIDVVGKAVDNVLPAPEDVLGNYDLVFTSALSAIEAMACGRPVIVCDGRGLAGMVTPERARSWRKKNFGLACLSRAVTPENLIEEIDLYDQVDMTDVTNFIREEACQERWLDRLVSLYKEIIDEHENAPRGTSFEELSEYIQTWAPRAGKQWPWLRERDQLVSELAIARYGIRSPLWDETVKFAGDQGEVAAFRLVEGFSQPEAWGVWMCSNTASLMILRPEGDDAPDLLHFTLRPFLPDARPELNVRVCINGIEIANWNFSAPDAGGARSVRCDLPTDLTSKQIWVSFHIDKLISPFECGLSDDRRQLGLGLIDFSFASAGTKAD